MKRSRTFVMGDIHGAYRALRQCLQRSDFDYQDDHLIFLGDVCDGWPETKACFDELLRIRNLTFIMGNHDMMSMPWMLSPEIKDEGWLFQGGLATISSYPERPSGDHVNLLKQAKPYHLLGNVLFTHAGFDPAVPLEKQDKEVFCWDRALARKVLTLYNTHASVKLTPFDEVYLGHTPIPFDRPIYSCGVWMMDTGAGWRGPLSMMNIESKEIISSDPVPQLYPGIKGRAG